MRAYSDTYTSLKTKVCEVFTMHNSISVSRYALLFPVSVRSFCPVLAVPL